MSTTEKISLIEKDLVSVAFDVNWHTNKLKDALARQAIAETHLSFLKERLAEESAVVEPEVDSEVR